MSEHILWETIEEQRQKNTELEKEAGDYAEEHAFRVPYDGSNKFYDDVDFKASKEGYLAGAEPREKRIAELEQENAILEKALNLYVDWADECGIAWDNFPDMEEKWYKKVEEKNLGWIAGLTFMVKEEAKEQLVKECENGK